MTKAKEEPHDASAHSSNVDNQSPNALVAAFHAPNTPVAFATPNFRNQQLESSLPIPNAPYPTMAFTNQAFTAPFPSQPYPSFPSQPQSYPTAFIPQPYPSSYSSQIASTPSQPFRSNPESLVNFCRFCGKKYLPNSAFCYHCGAHF